jgi:hypothetical protein
LLPWFKELDLSYIILITLILSTIEENWNKKI